VIQALIPIPTFPIPLLLSASYRIPCFYYILNARARARARRIVFGSVLDGERVMYHGDEEATK